MSNKYIIFTKKIYNKIVTFNMPQGKIGIGICFDIRFPQHSKIMRDLNCNLLVYPPSISVFRQQLKIEAITSQDNLIFNFHVTILN